MELIIFDMDGLMFDTETIRFEAFMKLGKEKHLKANKEMYLTLLGKNKKDICKQYISFWGNQCNPEAIYKELGHMADQIMKENGIPVKKGLYELLDYLKEHSYKMAVASGSSKKDIESYLEQTKTKSYFDCIVSTTEVKNGKPYPDVFLHVCDLMKCKPEQALVLEDSENGVKAALAGKIKVIAVPDLIDLPKELEHQVEDKKKDLTEVIAWLQECDA